ncbi:hypothetical protein ACFOY4_39535 [Actinomadura syzygii]|uniref:hypothetical protein n=1 Tax=Actinomadura syzygii TaxID=1427538 RepID=UPI0016526FC7|nr:hypothetical protein [Actinomadura syzygii]
MSGRTGRGTARAAVKGVAGRGAGSGSGAASGIGGDVPSCAGRGGSHSMLLGASDRTWRAISPESDGDRHVASAELNDVLEIVPIGGAVRGSGSERHPGVPDGAAAAAEAGRGRRVNRSRRPIGQSLTREAIWVTYRRRSGCSRFMISSRDQWKW